MSAEKKMTNYDLKKQRKAEAAAKAKAEAEESHIEFQKITHPNTCRIQKEKRHVMP